MTEELILNFFSDIQNALLQFVSFLEQFLYFCLGYPIVFYLLFIIVVPPMLFFLLGWIQDFVSDGIGEKYFGRHNPLPPNVYAKEKEGIRGFNRFIRSSRLKRIKEMEMKRGRIYKTKTLVYKGKKYRYVTSERAPEDFQGNFNTDE